MEAKKKNESATGFNTTSINRNNATSNTTNLENKNVNL